MKKKALENGTFNWSGYTLLAETFKEMQEKQLINKDILTAKPSQLVELMAQGKIGFTLSVTSIGPDTREVNPDIQLGVMRRQPFMKATNRAGLEESAIPLLSGKTLNTSKKQSGLFNSPHSPNMRKRSPKPPHFLKR